MKPPVDRIQLSQTAKEQLLKLKRITKIDQWNILCRWAFCCSLAEPTPPSPISIATDSNVIMTWKVFGGVAADLLLVALQQRCHQQGLGTDSETLAHQIRLHLHRGIGYLAGDSDLNTLEDLIALTVQQDQRLI